MKKIIVPFDFSPVSINALRFGMDMYGRAAHYTVTHIMDGLLDMDDTVHPEALEGQQGALHKRMLEMILKENGWEELPANVSLEVLAGNVIPRLEGRVQEGEFDGMVMGTRDKYDLFDRWFGTVTLAMVKQLDLPIFLIPIYSQYKGFEHVMVANDGNSDTASLVDILRWNEAHKAKLTFLHVSQEEGDISPKKREANIQQSLDKEGQQTPFDIQVVKSEQVSESLLGYAYNNRADLMIVQPEHHSFMHTLLFKSVSRDLISKSNIPLLFLPNKG